MDLLNLILPLRKFSTSSSFAEIMIVSNKDIFSGILFNILKAEIVFELVYLIVNCLKS